MVLRWVGVGCVIVAGCGSEKRDPGSGVRDTLPVASVPGSRSPAPGTRAPVILFLGTSLTAGYGLSGPELAYPALIQAKLDSAGRPYRVVNAGVSGESSAGALDRIDWLLRSHHVAVLVVET